MRLKLPAKNAQATTENVEALYKGLTSVIAGHSGSIQLWTFYEEVDAYLGPWGKSGYPIGYGKYYCKLFNENRKLLANAQGAHWLTTTTIALQESLRDFIVERFKQGKLSSLTESELRAAAFGSHSKAYSDSGLAIVILIAPDLIPVILSIPGKEFDPRSPYFNATRKQVLDTMQLTLPSVAGTMVAAAMPVHSGLFRRAAERTYADQMQEVSTGQWLNDTERALRSGKMDSIIALTRLTDRLNATQFGNQAAARRAREIVEVADRRKHSVATYYRNLITENPGIRPSIDKADPNWSRW